MKTSGQNGIMHIDSAYTLAEARARGKMTYLLSRDASGFFGRLWSVHPAADSNGADLRHISARKIARNHAVIEGMAALCRLPRFLAPLNLLISQVALYRLLVRIVRQQRLSVVVGVDPFLSGLLALAVARSTRRPLVIRISGNHDDIYEASGALAMPRLLPSHWLQKESSASCFAAPTWSPRSTTTISTMRGLMAPSTASSRSCPFPPISSQFTAPTLPKGPMLPRSCGGSGSKADVRHYSMWAG